MVFEREGRYELGAAAPVSALLQVGAEHRVSAHVGDAQPRIEEAALEEALDHRLVVDDLLLGQRTHLDLGGRVAEGPGHGSALVRGVPSGRKQGRYAS